jgi:glyoxylate reductase
VNPETKIGKTMAKAVVVLTRHWTAAAEAAMSEVFETRLNSEDRELPADDIVARCQGADVLCPIPADVIDAGLIARLPDSIKIIAVFGAGTENVDVAAAQARGLFVSNTPGAVAEDTADVAFALLLATCRRLVHGDRELRAGRWGGGQVDDPLAGQRASGKTLGIVGLGGIGSAVARRARAFRMPLIYHSRNRAAQAEAACEARYCARLDELLEEADIVSLHCPLTPETHHLIDAAALARMKPGSVLINTARGPVVDEAALIEALQKGTIAAAGLDVYEREPEVPPALVALENVVLSPHLGTACSEARYDMGFRVRENIEAFLADGRPLDPVTA